MFCSQCGMRLPEGKLNFCPNCGARVFPIAPVAPEAMEEPAVPEAAEEPIVPEATEEPVEPEAMEEPAVPEAPAAPEAARESAPVVRTAPAASPAEEKPRGLLGPALTALILTALTFLLATFAIICMVLRLETALLAVFSTMTSVLAPLAIVFAFVSFVLGLVKRRPGTWIVGLLCLLVSFGSILFGILRFAA